MFKQKVLFTTSILLSSLGFCISQAWSAVAPSTALNVAVTGQVQFQQRTTFAPTVQCQSPGPCEKPKPYWSLVVQTEGNQYEIDKPYDVGGEKAPTLIELSGLQLRPGSIVKLEGTAVSEGANFFVLTQLKKVDLVMNAEWICKNAVPSDLHLVAHIIYKPDSVNGGAYQLHLEEVDDHATYSIAQIDRAFFKEFIHNSSINSESYDWIFGGATRSVDIVLDIVENSTQTDQVPAKLKIARRGSPTETDPPVISEIDMICSQ